MNLWQLTLDAAKVVEQAEARFTTAPGHRWWWEVLREDLPFQTCNVRAEDFGLVGIVCPDAPAWLLVSDDSDQPWPVYEAHPSDVARILEESPFFEFVIVAKDMTWLVLENHHNVFIAVGEPVATNLRKVAG